MAMVGKVLDNLLKGSLTKLKKSGAPEFQLVIVPEYDNEIFVGYIYTRGANGKFVKSNKFHTSDLVKFLNEIEIKK